MSCANNLHYPLVVVPAPRRMQRHRPAFIGMLVTLYEAFEEAMAMRRAACRKYHFIDE